MSHMRDRIVWPFFILLVAILAAWSIILITWPYQPALAQSGGSMIQGIAGNGSAIGTVRPVAVGGSDGTDARTFAVDVSGDLKIVGPTADGGGASNGVVVAGKDASNFVRTIATDSGGRAIINGPTADGSLPPTGNSVDVGGKDNSGNAQSLTVVPAGSAGGSSPRTLIVGGEDGGALVRSLSTDTTGRLAIIGATANATAPTGNPLLIAGYDAGSNVIRYIPVAFTGNAGGNIGSISAGEDASGNARIIATDSVGRLSHADTTKTTYSIGGTFVPAANPQDVLVIQGSGTKTVKVRSISIIGTQTTAGPITVFLIRRSSADTGSGSTSQTVVPNDSTDAAATAVVTQWTTNPNTQGTAVGTLACLSVFTPAALSVSASPPLVFQAGLRGQDKAYVLNGTGQYLAVNLGAIAYAGLSLTYSITWTEE